MHLLHNFLTSASTKDNIFHFNFIFISFFFYFLISHLSFTFCSRDFPNLPFSDRRKTSLSTVNLTLKFHSTLRFDYSQLRKFSDQLINFRFLLLQTVYSFFAILGFLLFFWLNCNCFLLFFSNCFVDSVELYVLYLHAVLLCILWLFVFKFLSNNFLMAFCSHNVVFGE